MARIGEATERVAGPKSLAGRGDFVLENDRVRVVLDAPEHPHGLGSTGGAILDLAPLGSASGGDQTNTIYQAAGLLPRDAVHYQTAEILDPGLSPADPHAYAAVIFRGHLEGDARVTVVTRYEVRPCEDGVRVRSDLFNGAQAPNTLYLTDGFFWGDNGPAPFVPAKGMGFVQPDLDLLHIDAAWRTWPFIAARVQAPPETAYAVVSCDHTEAAGFTSTTLSSAGIPLGITQPGDGFHFERFIAAVPSDGTRPALAGTQAPSAAGLAPAVAEALRVRSALHGDPPAVTVTGRMVANGASRRQSGGQGRLAAVLRAGVRTGPRRSDAPDALERGRASGGRQLRCRAAAQSGLPRATLRLRDTRRSGQLVQRRDGRRGSCSDRRHLDHRLVAPDGERRIGAGRTGQLRRVGRDSSRRSSRGGRASAQPLQLVPGVRAHAGTARRRLARLQPRADLQRAVRPAAAAREVLRLRNSRPVRDPGSRRGRSRARADGQGHAAGRIAGVRAAARRRDVGGFPRPRRRQLRFVDPRPRARDQLPGHGRGHDRRHRPQRRDHLRLDAADAGRHAHAGGDLGRRTDAQHPLVLRARARVPAHAGPFQFLAAHARPARQPQRRALGRAARARPDDGRHGRAGRDASAQLNHPYSAAKLGRDQGYARAIEYDPRQTIPDAAHRRRQLRRQRFGAAARAAADRTATSTGTCKR